MATQLPFLLGVIIFLLLQQISRVGFLILALFCCLSCSHSAWGWEPLSPGLKYQQFKLSSINPFASIHAFDIDLDVLNMDFCNIDAPSTAKEGAKQTQALLAFTGAFFSTQNKPLGLRLSQGRILNKLKPISWWSVFYIHNKTPAITPSHQFVYNKMISFALQAGPRLLINKHIPQLKTGDAQRTALGIRADNHVLVVVTEHALISTLTLAQFMRDKLNCMSAINLDGGSSSQLYVNVEGFRRHVIGLSNLPDPICVYKK